VVKGGVLTDSEALEAMGVSLGTTLRGGDTGVDCEGTTLREREAGVDCERTTSLAVDDGKVG